MNIKKILVIIPTYNERDNIVKLIPAVLSQDSRIDILVVDDSSPDGTSEVVDKMRKKNDRISLLKRSKKAGLGTAYVEGFNHALKKDYDLIFEMDADFSHDPKEIPRFIEAMNEYDLVIGSRYISGVPVRDATSGFKCFRRCVLESIDLNNIHSDGYAFQIEMDFKAYRKGFRILEIPIIFVDRDVGVSKMNPGIVREAAFIVWKLRLLSLIGRL